jgi:hypothetical protein
LLTNEPQLIREEAHPVKTLLKLLLISIPLGRVLNVPVFESVAKVAPFSPNDAILTTLVVCYVVRRFYQGKRPFEGVPHGWLVLLFPAWACISLLVNMWYYHLAMSDILFSSLYLIRWCAYASLYFIVADVLKDGTSTKTILKWLVGGALGFCAFGMLQSIFLPPDFALWLYPQARPYIDYDPQGHRLVSTILDPNIAAGYILIFALIALSFLLHRTKHWWGIFLFLFIALILTLSRGGLLGFLVGFFAMALPQSVSRKRVLGVLLIVAILALVLYPLLQARIEEAQRISIDDASAMTRMTDWLLALDIIRSNFVFGIGFNTFGFVAAQYDIDREGGSAFGLAGDLMMIVALSGIVGLATYCYVVKKVFAGLAAVRIRSRSAWDRAFADGVRAATLGVMVSSFFTTLILYPQVMAVLWILWALGLSCEVRLLGDRPSVPIPSPALSQT